MGAVGEDLREALLVSEVRTVAADSLWLSPAYQRDVVGLHFTWRSDWRVVEPALALVERYDPRRRFTNPFLDRLLHH